ncbi:TonB-dependent receptor [Kangiella sp.]|uniref:TonB-dependent receptor n=1 Tax=Kangiella sp. TaxID=1920245 RepID=UPI0019875332|nr:TonB-dependent receptor [Kangiella sp.]MBD3654389.1 TonB-dependent receptor [Kangiella sp.]
MVEHDKTLTTEQKALAVNLNPTQYGTIVEIGAGQEVARQFFSAGAAAGTIAKTMSAYDMQVSDDIYGKAGRYVSRERVEQMLVHEYDLLHSRLDEVRSEDTQYFSYAATVTARSYTQKNECHGWIGIRMQLEPKAPPSEIVMHVRMLDETNKEQSEALGIFGVNVVYGAFHYHKDPKIFIESLLDNLVNDFGQKRIEVDLIHFAGHTFEKVENRLMNLHLVRSWCCRAVMFDAKGSSEVPGSMLRKKDVLVIRGSFKPPTKVHVDMTEAAMKQFLEEEGVQRDKVFTVAEITMAELANDAETDDASFLARVDLLNKLGYNVLISDYLRFFRLRSWMRRYTQNRIGIVLSILDFDQLFNESYYDGLEGGILEAMGKLFSGNTNVYVYPTRVGEKLVTLDNVEVAENTKYLLKHLIGNKHLVATKTWNDENLHISARNIAKEIPLGQGDWEKQLPDAIRDEIKARCMFGYCELPEE